MDTSEMRQNYASVIELARGGGFQVPSEGWTAEQVVAHLSANDELFLAVGEAVRHGERPDYENLPSVTDEILQWLVAEAGGMPGLIDDLEATSTHTAAASARRPTSGEVSAASLQAASSGRICGRLVQR